MVGRSTVEVTKFEENLYSIKYDKENIFNYNFVFSICLLREGRVHKPIRDWTDFVCVWLEITKLCKNDINIRIH